MSRGGEEPGATAGASSRTKHSERGDTAGLVPLSLAPCQVGVCLLRGLGGPPWRERQHTASNISTHTYTGVTVGVCINDETFLKNGVLSVSHFLSLSSRGCIDGYVKKHN